MSDKLNLKDEVTVFLISVGGITYGDCVHALHNQTVDFKLETILNISPSPLAFQAMIDRCQTPYYIQVDEDMILNPDSIERLYNDIHDKPKEIAFVAQALWDVHLDRWIVGVKIYRHEIMKNYPYAVQIATEWNQVERLQADGFYYYSDYHNTKESCYGLHGTSFTDKTAYERYKGLMEKHRAHGHVPWIDEYFTEFYRRLKSNYNCIAEMSFAGLAIGSITTDIKSEKDSRKYNELPGMVGILANIEKIRTAFKTGLWEYVSAIVAASGLEYCDKDIDAIVEKTDIGNADIKCKSDPTPPAIDGYRKAWPNPNDWENPDCSYCGSKHDTHKLIYKNVKGTSHDLVECPVCQFRFYSPRIKFSSLIRSGWGTYKAAEDLAELYYANCGFTVVPESERPARHDWLMRYYKLLFQRVIDANGLPESMIEVGGACGYYAEAAREMGMKRYVGIEKNKYHVEIGRDRLGFDGMVFSTFAEYETEERFDAGVMLDYIEHSYTPWPDIQKMARLIKPGGSLLIKTFLEELDTNRTMEAPIGHPNHFYGHVLTKMLEDAGFEIIKVDHEIIMIVLIARRK